MIVIVETTFVVELVLEQDSSAACEEILRLTTRPDLVRLVLPVFSIAEAGMRLERKRVDRQPVLKSLNEQAREVRRSNVFATYARSISDLKSELLLAENSEDQRFAEFCASQMRFADTIELTKKIVNDALTSVRTGLVKKLPDAIVISSISSYFERIPFELRPQTCFVTPDRALLDAADFLDCKRLGAFTDAVAWIRKYGSPSN